MMKPLIVYYSFTGNNRLLAEHLAKELDCPAVPVLERGRRSMFTILLDLLFRRWPRVDVSGIDLEGYDHVLFVAPLWDRWIAHPMKAAIAQLKDRLPDYSFVHFSGGARPGQTQHVEEELTGLAGKRPVHVWSMYVSELVSPETANTPAASSYRATREQVEGFAIPREIVGELRHA